ncbi:MAG: hypothetical protein JOZ08_05755 [Verrucomicrobia bacterium]|nr:hypothetical protein [Verrucomicrobiota bacterium]
MNANEKGSTADGRRLTQKSNASELAPPGHKLTRISIRSIRVHSRPFAVAVILLLTAGMLAQPASAGPFDALRNFFSRPQPQPHVTHHHPAHPKDAPKEAPNDSASPTAPPVDQQQSNGAPQQQNGAPQQQNTLNTNTNNRPGRPAIAAAPLF